MYGPKTRTLISCASCTDRYCTANLHFVSIFAYCWFFYAKTQLLQHIQYWKKSFNMAIAVDWDVKQQKQMSRIMRKPDFCLGENKGADQLRGDREADQRLCFRYTDSTISLLLKSEISSC